MKNLQGKSVFITGGGAGLGRAMAERFTEEGSRVTIADIDPKSEAFANSINARFKLTNVTDPASVAAAIEFCVAEAGRLDILVNNAGIESVHGALHEYDLQNWHKVMDINLNGVFYGMKFGLAQLVRQNSGGAVVNTASIASLVGFASVPPYTASKAAVANLTRSAALEYGPLGIRVNAVAPTVVLTALVQRQLDLDTDPEKRLEFYRNFNPLKGMPEPSDIAAAVAFLASDEARFINGVILPVDGGFTAG